MIICLITVLEATDPTIETCQGNERENQRTRERLRISMRIDLDRDRGNKREHAKESNRPNAHERTSFDL